MNGPQVVCRQLESVPGMRSKSAFSAPLVLGRPATDRGPAVDWAGLFRLHPALGASKVALKVTEEQSVRDPEGKRLVRDCLNGDPAAKQRFQQEYGSLIIEFAARSRHCYGDDTSDLPGDFYIYAFERDRLYRRLESFKGIRKLKGFLYDHVLPRLLAQFLARRGNAPELVLLGDDLAQVSDEDLGYEGPASQEEVSSATDLLTQLSIEKQVTYKLLYIEDNELTEAEVQYLARTTRRSVRDVIEVIEQAGEAIRNREVARKERHERAESVGERILQYARRLARLRDKARNLPPRSTQAERLACDIEELERKRNWRQQQLGQLLVESRRAKVTLPYDEMARILGETRGTVSARVCRVRQELQELLQNQIREERRN